MTSMYMLQPGPMLYNFLRPHFLTNVHDKLERLSLASISSLV
jgi:hypothetical protein